MSETTKQVVDVSISASKFTANGKEYFIETNLSVNRHIKYQELEIELAWGYSVSEMHGKFGQAVDMLNKLKLVDASVLLHNMATGMDRMQTRYPAVYRLCALYMNTADEDRTDISDEQIMAKIEDWKAEGIASAFFLAFAKAIMLGFTGSLNSETEVPKEQGENQQP